MLGGHFYTVGDTPAAGEILIIDEADYDAAENYSPGYLMVDGTIYVGQDGSGTEVAFADLVSAERSSQLVSAYEAKEASAATVTSAKTALEDSIEDVILAENEAYELVSDLETATVVSYSAGDKDNAAATIDLTQSVDVYKTEAAKTEKTAEVQTLAITADDTDDDDEGLDVTYGNDDSTGSATVNVDLSSGTLDVTDGAAVATAVASALNNDTTFAGLATASASGTDVTITYDGTLEGTDVGTTVSSTATGTTGTLAGAGSNTTAGGTGTTTSVDAADADTLLDAITASEDFAELVALFEEARSLDADLTTKEEAVTAAEEAIENDTDAVEDPGLGLTIVDFATATLTADSEVTVFEDSVDTDVDLTDFGTGGEDTLYFGSDYTFVAMGEDESITDRLGDADTLEVFYEETSGGVVFYAEEDAEAGRDSTDAAITTVTLVGQTLEDVTINGGMVTAGEVA